jgi:hypothetical protein
MLPRSSLQCTPELHQRDVIVPCAFHRSGHRSGSTEGRRTAPAWQPACLGANPARLPLARPSAPSGLYSLKYYQFDAPDYDNSNRPVSPSCCSGGMYRRIFRARSATDVKTPRARKSRSILANQSSTWFVGDHMNLAAGRLRAHDVAEEFDKRGAGVTRDRVAQHLAGLRVEGGEERERAVAVLLESVSFCAPRRQRQDRIEAVERLDGRFLIDGKHGRVVGRIDIQADHVGGLRLEVGVVRPHIAPESMGLQPGTPPRLADEVVVNLQQPTELPGTSMGGAVGRGLSRLASTRASIAGVSTVGGWPRYRASSPSRRRARKRLRPRLM